MGCTLRTDSEFKRVFSAGSRFFRNGLGFYVGTSEALKFRYGMAIPRRYGKAVERNKVRRRLRELIRMSLNLPPVHVVICIYKPCRDFSFEFLKETLSWGLARITGGLRRHGKLERVPRAHC